MRGVIEQIDGIQGKLNDRDAKLTPAQELDLQIRLAAALVEKRTYEDRLEYETGQGKSKGAGASHSQRVIELLTQERELKSLEVSHLRKKSDHSRKEHCTP